MRHDAEPQLHHPEAGQHRRGVPGRLDQAAKMIADEYILPFYFDSAVVHNIMGIFRMKIIHYPVETVLLAFIFKPLTRYQNDISCYSSWSISHGQYI